ncbi:GTP-binding protein ypt5 [Tritrichomonas foetus]|uniref:GTP-binding protein ypt5 n=1 Tax=Tritrichomonas foetus TaxID=1144522 RepID=A0A1J4JEZ5_9EUKA|nr:GTP-binding protein ypt5 [Tritrichomonas foetus]|eukprot:OHS96021.1 GTP-binding protein ypt5 [Tritrichomonas foetus]
MNDRHAQRPAKVIMLGDSSVGKTSIVLQFYKSEFESTSEPTVGAAYVTKVMKTSNGELPLHIWDTAGQERFKSVIPMYMRGCSAIVLVSSTDSIDSIKALNDWMKIVRDTVEDIENIYLVLNKIDKEPTYDISIAEAWAKERNYKFFQTSAKEKQNIDELFQTIAEDISSSQLIVATPVTEPELSKEKKACC